MIEHTVRELLEDKVQLDVEGIDRLYLNAYQPRLQTGGGVVSFFKGHRGAQVASTTLMAPMSRDFVAAIHAFAKRQGDWRSCVSTKGSVRTTKPNSG